MVEFDYVYAKKKMGRPNFFYHKIGSLIIWIYRKDSYRALAHAEKELGRPVNYPELIRAYRQITKKPLFIVTILRGCLEDFHRDDKILFDREGDRYSVNPRMQHTDDNPTGFHLYSDKIALKFPTYETD